MSKDLATTFSKLLRRTIGIDKLKEVVKRNASERNAIICHSHDFCDANMVMLEAYSVVHGINEDDIAIDDDKVMLEMSRAWSKAKEEHFMLDIPISVGAYKAVEKKIEEVYDKASSEADALLQEAVQNFLNNKSGKAVRFISGMGTWVFYDAHDDAIDDEDLPVSLCSLLDKHAELFGSVALPDMRGKNK